MPMLGFYTNKEYMEGCKSSKEFGEIQGKREARREYEKEIRDLHTMLDDLNTIISLKNIAINNLVNAVNTLSFDDIERLEIAKKKIKRPKVRAKIDSRISRLRIKKL